MKPRVLELGRWKDSMSNDVRLEIFPCFFLEIVFVPFLCHFENPQNQKCWTYTKWISTCFHVLLHLLRCGPLLRASLKHAAMSSLVLEACQLHLTSCRIAGGGLGSRSASGPKGRFVDGRNPANQLRLVDDLIILKGS